MAGIDLHGNNLFCGIVDSAGKRVFEKKLACDLPGVINALKPFKKRLSTIAVESTYNWYWLVDGLQDQGYNTVLANPAAVSQYNGLKHADDKSDAFFLAEMLRLNILPTGHICDRQLRPVRDLLRRRMGLVQKRTSLLLSFKSLHTRMTGGLMALGRLKQLEPADAQELFVHAADRLIARLNLQLVEQLNQSIQEIEKAVLAAVKSAPNYQALQTMPGVGIILGLTITLETEDIGRFAGPGHFASYARCVNSQRLSNGKKKGENNGKCGNKYLGWAFVEAAHCARRYDARARRFYDRKAAQTNTAVATKALACKLARAAWHMMRENAAYDPERIFPRGGGQFGQSGAKPDAGVGPSHKD
jgi:transposase